MKNNPCPQKGTCEIDEMYCPYCRNDGSCFLIEENEMREILFRGKKVDNEEWIEGYLYRISEKMNPFIMLPDRKGESYEVESKTVGQYTGLTDSNSKKIFEGDIMRSAGNIVQFCEDGFCINGDCSLGLWKKTEIIGNIYDNPELA